MYKWEYRLPQYHWPVVWKNLSTSLLPSCVHEVWYTVVHRMFPTNAKLHSIHLIPSETCELCYVPNTLEHRFTCQRSIAVWDTARDMLRLINRVAARDITPNDAIVPQCKAYLASKWNATLWLLGHTVYAIFRLRLTTDIDSLTYLWA